MRIACLLASDLPAAAAVRAEPELAGLPLAVVSEPGPRAAVLSVSPEAARAGVHRGSTLAHARSVCAALRARVASPVREGAARAALLDVALSISPRAEVAPARAGARAGEAIVHIDASGLRSLFPSEAGLASALVARARSVGLPAAAAVAGSRAVAELAARHAAAHGGTGTTCVIAPDGEAAFLTPLSVDLLDLDDALAETLTRFGIHHLGPLLALPRTALATRLGAEAQAKLAPLRGEGGELPIAAPEAPRIEESIDFEAPLESLEPFLFALAGLLSRLLARLAVRHLACAELALRLDLAAPSGAVPSGTGLAGGHDERCLRLAAPTSSPRTWLRYLRAALEREPPGAPVEGCSIAAMGCPLRRDQLDLFRPAGPAPAELDALLAELEALCGAGRVGAPRALDEHRPDAFAVAPFDPAGARAAGAKRGDFPSRPLISRALRPPLPAEVHLRAGLPHRMRSAVANGDVLGCAGPWRTSGGWWSEEHRFACDAFDVATSDGLLVRLRHDRLRGIWLVDAVYD